MIPMGPFQLKILYNSMTLLESIISYIPFGHEAFLLLLSYNSGKKCIDEVKNMSMTASPLFCGQPMPKPTTTWQLFTGVYWTKPKLVSSPSFSKHLHSHQLLM